MPEATSNHTTVPTRRHFLSQAASAAAGGTVLALAAIPLASAAAAPAGSPDPIFAMIAIHMELQAEWGDLYWQLDVAEAEAAAEHGRRPIELIHWRNYQIGASEIALRRQALLGSGQIDPATVEQEYLDAEARYKVQVDAGLAWDERVGLAAMRKDFDRRLAAEREYAWRLAHTKPATPAGAAGLLQHLLDDDLSTDGDYWHMTALRSVVASLNGMVAGGAVMKAGTAGRT